MCYIGLIATTDTLVLGSSGAGRAANLGEVSMSVSLEESPCLVVMALVWTIVIGLMFVYGRR